MKEELRKEVKSILSEVYSLGAGKYGVALDGKIEQAFQKLKEAGCVILDKDWRKLPENPHLEFMAKEIYGFAQQADLKHFEDSIKEL